MGIFIVAALAAGVLFLVISTLVVFVAAVGGACSESSVLRRIADTGEAKMASANLDREYRELLSR